MPVGVGLGLPVEVFPVQVPSIDLRHPVAGLIFGAAVMLFAMSRARNFLLLGLSRGFALSMPALTRTKRDIPPGIGVGIGDMPVVMALSGILGLLVPVPVMMSDRLILAGLVLVLPMPARMFGAFGVLGIFGLGVAMEVANVCTSGIALRF